MTLAGSAKLKMLVEIALGEVGVHEEGGDNRGAKVEKYQSVIGKAQGEPWCTSFIQWCLREADARFKTISKDPASDHLLARTESSQELVDKSPAICQILKPEPGCIVVWTKFIDNKPTRLGHAGIVKEIIDRDFMLVVEGNTSSSSSALIRNGDCVALKKRRIKSNTGELRTRAYLLPWA